MIEGQGLVFAVDDVMRSKKTISGIYRKRETVVKQRVEIGSGGWESWMLSGLVYGDGNRDLVRISSLGLDGSPCGEITFIY